MMPSLLISFLGTLQIQRGLGVAAAVPPHQMKISTFKLSSLSFAML